MKNYAEYMVASEEVMYVGSILDRLNFLDNVRVNQSGYDIGLLYVNKSDESIKKINSTKYKNLDSTLSIIDLSKVDKLEKSVDDFFNSINIEKDYRAVSRARMKTYTYGGDSDYFYDTVDLYELSESLKSIAGNDKATALQQSIKDAVKYNSAFNKYSNGISIYFPYFGSKSAIETHLSMFEKLSNDSYYSFINEDI